MTDDAYQTDGFTETVGNNGLLTEAELEEKFSTKETEDA